METLPTWIIVGTLAAVAAGVVNARLIGLRWWASLGFGVACGFAIPWGVALALWGMA